MKKLKLQFGLFFFFLALALGFLLLNSYRQMAIEEKSLWVGISEKVFNQMQATISDFLTQEDGRSFSEYRYYQALPGPEKNQQALSQSPLSNSLPEDDPKGLIGYFQIDPDGSFSTPYLPKGGSSEKREDLNQRMEKEKELKQLAQSLSKEVTPEPGEEKELKKEGFGFIDLTKKPTAEQGVLAPKKEALKGEVGMAQNIYPNPLLSQKENVMKAKSSNLVDEKVAEMKKKEAPSPKDVAMAPAGEALPAQSARREISPSPVQLKAFEEQNQDQALSPPKSAPVFMTGSAIQVPSPPASSNSPKADAGGGGGLFSLDSSRDRKADKQFKPETKITGRLTPSPPKPALQPSLSAMGTYHPPSLLIDPFQARLISDQSLIFYRKIWIDQKMYLQGFAVNLDRFFTWVMGQSFANSDLVQFAGAELDLGDKALASYGSLEEQAQKKILLFERALGYPLNAFLWKVYALKLPQLSTRLYLNLFTGIIILLTTVGLFFIYRSAAAEVLLSQKRQDFVSAVTHELKTPLTSIRMYSEMLEDGWVKEEEKKKEYYRHINKESGRLSHLIDNVLQLARLEKRTYKLNLKKADPSADFEQVGAELKKIAEPQGFSLVLEAGQTLPEISYDPEALQEILLILLDNSLKFSKNGFQKTLEMTLEPEGAGLVWSWKDRGPGIPSSELGRVFEKFYRVENEMTRNTKGTGIGLAMAKIVVEAMGAHIEAKNREGGGLWVRIVFPV